MLLERGGTAALAKAGTKDRSGTKLWAGRNGLGDMGRALGRQGWAGRNGFELSLEQVGGKEKGARKRGNCAMPTFDMLGRDGRKGEESERETRARQEKRVEGRR